MAAVVNIFLMMTANLVGFAVGVDGIREMAGQIFRPSGEFFRIFSFLLHKLWLTFSDDRCAIFDCYVRCAVFGCAGYV